MPKINVYLPEDLAAAVKEAGVPVSPICQYALASAVDRVKLARRSIALIREPGFDPAAYPRITAALERLMTARLTEAFGLARVAADGAPAGPVALLRGILDQGGNLGVRLLRALDVDTDDLAVTLAQADPSDGEPGLAVPDGGPFTGLTRSAWLVVATALGAAVDAGHNYIGCEHIVLGLLGDTAGAGAVLRAAGADPTAARKALAGLMSGYMHGRDTTIAAGSDIMRQILGRLDALESRVAALGPVQSSADGERE